LGVLPAPNNFSWLGLVLMAKGKKRSRAGSNWAASDHVAQQDKKSKSVQRQDRTARLTHNTQEKREAAKIKLHRTKIQRAIDELRHRLEHWDPVEEAARETKRLDDEKKKPPDDAEAGATKKGRKGPETWKLKGAARPAWEVYDFDTRYVDPHVAAHTAALERTQRSQNILALYRGRLLAQTVVPVTLIRDYLGMLMQLGYISLEAKLYKAAREAWLECIELEGDPADSLSADLVDPVTSAREALMRLYIDLKKWDAALSFGQRFPSDDSCVVRYSMALAACQLDQDEGQKEQCLVQAVKCNIFAAYYLCYYDTFVNVIEYTEDLQDSEEAPQSSLEEALEYCSSDHGALWQTTSGAVEALLRVINDRSLVNEADIEWEKRLRQIEGQLMPAEPSRLDDEDATKPAPTLQDASSNGVDIRMFAGMFRTAMEMCLE
jgi:hypothetical protein